MFTAFLHRHSIDHRFTDADLEKTRAAHLLPSEQQLLMETNEEVTHIKRNKSDVIKLKEKA